MNGIGTKTIETERLILRKMNDEDAEFIYKNWSSDPLVSKYVSWDTHNSLEETKKYVEYKVNRYIEHDFCFDWIVVLKETKEPIGEIEAVNVSKLHNLVEMGNCYGSIYWNKGYGTEALKAFINYMFNEVEVDKIIACHESVNPASGRIMQKAGMHYDGTLKNYFIDKNTKKRCDKICYSIDRKIEL